MLWLSAPAPHRAPASRYARASSIRLVRHEKNHGNATSSWWFGGADHWTLPSGSPADFECVDMLELDENGLITALHIFYDTAATRPAFERETGGSWRPAG
jgi:hypothetical protein